LVKPTGKVYLFGLDMKTSATSNSFQQLIKLNMTTVRSAGLEIGRMIWIKARHKELK